MNIQKKALLAVGSAFVLASVGGVASVANAQQPPPRQTIHLDDAAGGSTVVSVVGEVTAIDVANRIVSIKGPRGNIGEMRVDPAVRNLEQVKVGDRVRLSYRVGIALALVKGGDGIRERVETEGAAVAAKGARPGGIAVKRTTIVANVLSVDAKRKLATLQGPSGQLFDVKVRDPQVLRDVKAGDQVAANFTESVALRVTPAPAAK